MSHEPSDSNLQWLMPDGMAFLYFAILFVMRDRIEKLQLEISALTAESPEEVEQLRLKYLSKKGIIPLLFEEFRDVPPAEKKETGQLLNVLKNAAQEKINGLKNAFETREETSGTGIDLSRPVDQTEPGSHDRVAQVSRGLMVDSFQCG